MLKDKLIDYDPETGRVNSPPQQIFLEVSGRCNLACVHCSKDYGTPELQGEVDLPVEVVQHLAPWLHKTRFVNLNIVGESLLSPHFDDVVRICCAGEAEVSFNTNGLLLDDRRCDFLVEQGVHSVSISFDGIESNQAIRGVKYEVVRERLLRLARARERAGSALPHIGVAFTLTRGNTFELPRLLEDLLPRTPIHAVHIQPLIIFYETLRGENSYDQEAVDKVVEDSREIAARNGSEFILFRSQFGGDERFAAPGEQPSELGPHSERYGCTDPFFEIKVRSTGEVMSCSYGREFGIDVRSHDLDEIWNGPGYLELRKALYDSRFEGRCEGCPYVHGSAQNQRDPIRPGVEHSRAERFRAGNSNSS